MATKFLKFLEEAYLNLKNLAILATVVADNQTFESWLPRQSTHKKAGRESRPAFQIYVS
jgi:hypothetical protein